MNEFYLILIIGPVDLNNTHMNKHQYYIQTNNHIELSQVLSGSQ